MSKFRKKVKGGTQQLSTASLPDIVFMLLFFFMVTTTMREVEYKVSIKLPKATEVRKLEKKSLVSYIYIGEPQRRFQGQFGTEPRIQLNDKISDLGDIQAYIEGERAQRAENDVPLMTYSLKVDANSKMGIVTDVKQELRNVQALKLNYSTLKKQKKDK